MPNPAPRVLIVEDEPSLRLGLCDGLRSEGFQIAEAANGNSAVNQLLSDTSIDAVLLDLMLPDIDGLEVLRRVRCHPIAVPILILSARGEDADRILGFEYGADDFMVKPAPLREVALRLRAVLRRNPTTEPTIRRVSFGKVRVDFDAYSLTREGKRYGLNRKEKDLLQFFLQHVGEPIDRHRLLQEVWGQRNPSASRTVDTHVFRLRKKIERDPENPLHLLTVHGVGYRFETE